jgi:hypothetical protein
VVVAKTREALGKVVGVSEDPVEVQSILKGHSYIIDGSEDLEIVTRALVHGRVGKDMELGVGDEFAIEDDINGMH